MTVQVGIVGLGQMGKLHARNIISAGGKIVGGEDVSHRARQRFEQEFNVPTYTDYEGLLSTASTDAVVITTPNRYHEPAAIAALTAGCDVLIEKPLAHSLDSANRIAEAAENAPGFCMVGFHSRFSPAALTARSYLDKNRFGDIAHIEATFVRRRGIPSHGSWFTDRSLSGGGSLIDIGVHAIDLSLFLLDFPRVIEVSGAVRSNFGDQDNYVDPAGFGATRSGDGDFNVDDSVSAFVRCVTGQTISLEIAWATNRSPECELIVRGTEAGAKFDMEGETVTMYEACDLGVDHYRTSELQTLDSPDPHLLEIKQFLECVESGVSPVMNSVDEGVAVQQVVDAIYQSSETHGALDLEQAATGTAD